MHKLIATLIFSMATVGSFAADMNEPFDFSYTINGRNNRPVTVFNDGESTFIQAKDRLQLFIAGQNVEMRGPYYEIKGVPEIIEGFSGNEAFKIQWQGALRNSITNEFGRKNGDFNEKTFSGTFGRLAFINGVPPDVGLTNPLPKDVQLKELVKALAPHGWSGAADKSINTTQQVSLSSSVGDSWITVLDRLITSLNIWAEIDSSKMGIYLRDTPPKGFSVVLEANSQLRKPHAISNGTPVVVSEPGNVIPVNVSESLLTMVNIRVIEQKAGNIVISVLNSGKRMKYTNLESGLAIEAKSLSPVDFTFPIIGSFRIETDNGNAIDIKRIFKKVPVFKTLNDLALKKVEIKNGTTIFTFARQLPAIEFKNSELVSVSGVWKNDEFIVNTTSPEWKIMTPQSAVQVDMEDKAVFLWKKSSSIQQVPPQAHSN